MMNLKLLEREIEQLNLLTGNFENKSQLLASEIRLRKLISRITNAKIKELIPEKKGQHIAYYNLNLIYKCLNTSLNTIKKDNLTKKDKKIITNNNNMIISNLKPIMDMFNQKSVILNTVKKFSISKAELKQHKIKLSYLTEQYTKKRLKKLGTIYVYLEYTNYILNKLKEEVLAKQDKYPEKIFPIIIKSINIGESILQETHTNLVKAYGEKESYFEYIDINSFQFKLATSNLLNAYKKVAKSQKIMRKLQNDIIENIAHKKEYNKSTFGPGLLRAYTKIKKSIVLSSVSVQNCMKFIDINLLLSKQPESYIIDHNKVKQGDILLFYKTEKSIKKSLPDYIASQASNSRVTHSTITYSNRRTLKHLHATAHGHKVMISDVHFRHGTIVLVFRPQIIESKRKRLLKSIRDWGTKLKEFKGKYKYSELKFWFAVIPGLITFALIPRLTGRMMIYPNPIKTKNAYYCSELIESIFKQAQIYLISRSEYGGILGPSEIIHSPYLKFIGIVCHPEDKELVKNEKFII